MAAYLQVRKNGQITLPAQILRKAKLSAGDVLEVLVDRDGTVLLVPMALEQSLAEKYQLDDVEWAQKQKGKKG